MSHSNQFSRPRKMRGSCDFCTASKLKCSKERPACERCIRGGREETCTYSAARPPGRRKRPSTGSFYCLTSDAGHHNVGVDRSAGSAAQISSSDWLRMLDAKGPDYSGREASDSEQDGLSGISESRSLIQHTQFDGTPAGSQEISTPDEDLFATMINMPVSWDHQIDGSAFADEAALNDFDTTWAQENDLSWAQESDKTPPTMMTPMSLEGTSTMAMIQPQDRCKRQRSVDESDGQPQSVRTPFRCHWPKSFSEVLDGVSAIAPRHPRSEPPPLDSLLLAEEKWVSLQRAAAKNSSMTTELITTSLFASMVDMLKEHFRDLPEDGLGRQDASSPPRESGREPRLQVGGFRLAEEVTRKCMKALIKRRLRIHLQMFNSMMRDDSQGVFSGAVRSAAAAMVPEVEGLLGMLSS